MDESYFTCLQTLVYKSHVTRSEQCSACVELNRDIHKWVTSRMIESRHMQMSHCTRMSESCHMQKVARAWMWSEAFTNERDIHKWATHSQISHIWMSHVSYGWGMSHMDELIVQVWIIHVTCKKWCVYRGMARHPWMSRVTYKWVMAHVWMSNAKYYMQKAVRAWRYGDCSCWSLDLDEVQHTAKHCNTLQHTATYWNTLQRPLAIALAGCLT